MGLKKALKTEQEGLYEAYIEFKEERTSPSSAVEASLALMPKIQNEKSWIEMEARQDSEIAKQIYYRQVIEYLGCIISNYESHRGVQEIYLNLSKKGFFTQSLSDGAMSELVEDQIEQGKRYLMDRDKLEEEPKQCEMDDPMNFYCTVEGDCTVGAVLERGLCGRTWGDKFCGYLCIQLESWTGEDVRQFIGHGKRVRGNCQSLHQPSSTFVKRFKLIIQPQA